jgi:hypothetical protein
MIAIRSPSYGIFFQTLIICVLCVITTVLYGSWGRPIWIDEFLHFAVGSFDSTSSAWSAIAGSTSNVNHGQTGIYMLINFWLLKLWGASEVALRLPSLLSAFLLCFFASFALRLRGYGLAWQALAIFIMLCQSYLMYYTGEARPYMPLASATIGTLCYAIAPLAMRKNISIRLVGIFSIIWGVLMHPYFALYWAVLFLFGFWLVWFSGEFRFTLSNFFKFLNVRLCLIGSFIYFLLASQTWLTGSPAFDRNPFEYIPQSKLYELLVWHHTTFMGFPNRGEKLLWFCALAPMFYVFLPKKSKTLINPTVPPMVLILLAMALTGIISSASYYQHYWILTRQWVGSIAIIAVAFVWLCASAVQLIADLLPKRLSSYFLWLAIFCLSLYFWRINSFNTLNRWTSFTTYLTDTVHREEVQAHGTLICPIAPDTWVRLANLNISASTAVWPIFKYYYQEDNPYCSK